jgi:hypothetical protein
MRDRIDGKQRRHMRGLSLVEALIALAISAVLLTATMVAIDASFRAYATATDQAASQAGTRMVMNRLLTLIRTSTAHGPLEPVADVDFPVTADPGDSDVMESGYIELMDGSGNIVRVEYRGNDRQLWLITTPPAGEAEAQPLLDDVSGAEFSLLRREDEEGLLVLERATIDLTVDPESDPTLYIERSSKETIRMVGSTIPRTLDE